MAEEQETKHLTDYIQAIATALVPLVLVYLLFYVQTREDLD